MINKHGGKESIIMKKADYTMMKDLTCTCSMTIHILIHNYNYLVVFT